MTTKAKQLDEGTIRKIVQKENQRAERVRIGFQINLTQDEKVLLSEAASLDAKPLAVFIREASIRAAEKKTGKELASPL